MFTFIFSYKVCEPWCVSYTLGTSRFRTATPQVLTRWWPLDSAALIPPSRLRFQVSPGLRPPQLHTHTCRIPSQCVFIGEKVLCKLIVRGWSPRPSFCPYISAAKATPETKLLGGHKSGETGSQFPLSSQTWSPTHPREGEGVVGEESLFPLPPGCYSHQAVTAALIL